MSELSIGSASTKNSGTLSLLSLSARVIISSCTGLLTSIAILTTNGYISTENTIY